MRRLLRFALVGIALALIGAEIVLRTSYGLGDPPLAQLDPDIEYTLVPDRSYMRFGNRVDINAQGLRTAPFDPAPADDETRILLIGDSVIYGNHFLDQAQTVAVQMQAALGQACAAPRVIPVAVSSWGPVNQAAYLDRYGSFGASTALIVLSGHDLYDTPTHSRNLVPYRIWPSPTALDDAARAVLQRLPLFQGGGAETGLSPEAHASASLEALTAMVRQLRADGAAPWLIYHPTLPERAGGALPARDVFANWARAADVPFTDLGTTLPDPGAYRDHIHPAADGAARLGAHLAALLQSDPAVCE